MEYKQCGGANNNFGGKQIPCCDAKHTCKAVAGQPAQEFMMCYPNTVETALA
jgi:hypothetical protein